MLHSTEGQNFYPISRRIAGWILVFGVLFTLATIGIRLYFAYYDEQATLRQQIVDAAHSHQASLTQALWDVDLAQVDQLLADIRRFPGVTGLHLTTSIGKSYRIMAPGAEFNDRLPVFAVSLRHPSTPQSELGQLTVYGNLTESNRRLRYEAIEIIATQVIQVFALSLLIAYLTTRLLTRHVVDLAQHLGTLTPQTLNTRFVLQRKTINRKGQTDELDALAEKINSLQSELVIHNDGLNREVAERTELLEAANRELKKMARIDHLTGIANRRHFDETASSEFRRALRYSQPLSLLMLDVDYFKLFNDSYGHQQGDDCLKAIGHLLRHTFVRAGELPARIGGEEFAVLLPGSEHARARKIAEDLRAALWELALPHAASTIADRVTISVGVASFDPVLHDSFEALLAESDLALYNAKRLGRNQIASVHGPSG